MDLRPRLCQVDFWDLELLGGRPWWPGEAKLLTEGLGT